MSVFRTHNFIVIGTDCIDDHDGPYNTVHNIIYIYRVILTHVNLIKLQQLQIQKVLITVR
jgi:hypothetical protein